MKNHAFTLIELLVVVLIIGILSAIALPQYQKAVDRARYMQAVTLAEAVAKANQVYFLANNEYAHSFDELDVQLPTPTSIDDHGYWKYPWGYCYIADTSRSKTICQVYVGKSSDRLYYSVDAQTGQRRCFATKDTKRANDICKSVTGKTQGSTTGDYVHYSFN